MAETGTVVQNTQDVVAFLHAQHEQIKQLFDEVGKARGQARQDSFVRLRRMPAVHETAEEEIVHPKAKKELPAGETVVEQRLVEEHEAKEALRELEGLDVDSPEFESKFRQLQAAVLAHAQAEEHQEFSKLAAELGREQLEKMRRSVELAEKMAPTRPHPGVESVGANMLVGPFAAMLDRARDAVTGRS
jgi:hemerythrin superfamily protein